jgi:hypothetical protein
MKRSLLLSLLVLQGCIFTGAIGVSEKVQGHVYREDDKYSGTVKLEVDYRRPNLVHTFHPKISIRSESDSIVSAPSATIFVSNKNKFPIVIHSRYSPIKAIRDRDDDVYREIILKPNEKGIAYRGAFERMTVVTRAADPTRDVHSMEIDVAIHGINNFTRRNRIALIYYSGAGP